MPRAVGCSQYDPVTALGDPVEISTHNIPGFKKDKVFRKEVLKNFVSGQNCILDLLGVIETVFDLLVLLFDVLFLGLNLQVYAP